jgi:hypothetical protein
MKALVENYLNIVDKQRKLAWSCPSHKEGDLCPLG